MLTTYFQAPRTLERLRRGSTGPHMDGFAAAVGAEGYAQETMEGYLYAVARLGRWADRRGIALSAYDDGVVVSFVKHLRRYHRAGARKGVLGAARAGVGAKRFLTYLHQNKIIVKVPKPPRHAVIAIFEEFRLWMLKHRGVMTSTLRNYENLLRPFFAELGEDPASYDVARIRTCVISRVGSRGRDAVRRMCSALRVFLRFLVAEGRVAPFLDRCVPTVTVWRLSSLPRYLEQADVARVIASCDQAKPHGLRDRAALLLLARLGLRAGDIVAMCLSDIDWSRGTLRVSGKSRREALLPLPQDVGDALLSYLEHGRPRVSSERVFLTACAPHRPLGSHSAVYMIVRFALERAGVQGAPSRGAHMLRHSAATAMLRSGSTLEAIGTVLRHQSSETTALYAKVDVGMLLEVAQPWPVVASC